MNMREVAEKNLVEMLRDNPCRGIVVGANGRGDIMQMTWIMGRSPNSQNRVYTVEDDTVKTEAADPSKVKDPSLIIYTAMALAQGSHSTKAYIIGNGDQTITALNDFELAGICESRFYDAMGTRHCEPDASTFTPRITAYVDPRMPKAVFSVLKADPIAKEKWVCAAETGGLKRDEFKSADDYNDAVSNICGLNWRKFPTIRNTFSIPMREGYGHCLTTYMPGSKALPSFEGEPFLVPVAGTLEEAMQKFWSSLEPEWKVALAGRQINDDGSYKTAEPINRFTKVEGAK